MSTAEVRKKDDERQWGHFFAGKYFNDIWTLLDKPAVSKEDCERMLHLAHGSFAHWQDIGSKNPENISIGYWMLSRVYAFVKNGTESLRYAERCITVSEENNLSPFYQGYGYEALARAYSVQEKHEQAEIEKNKASILSEQVTDPEEKQLLIDDINTL